MKLSIKIFFIAVTILIVLAGAAYLFIAFQGKAIIVKKLQDLTQKKVSMDYIGFSGPLNLEIKNLQIEGLLKADYVFISPSILGFFMGRVALDEVKIVKPELTFEKVPSQIPATAPAVGGGAPVQAKKRYTLPLIIKQIDIKDGRLDFIDRTVGTEGMKIIIKDISFHLDNLYIFPRSVVTNFKLQGKVPWQQEAEEGKIEFAGWINLLKRDMQATLRIEDIDGIHFYPYYSKWVDLEKSRIEKAKLNFNSDIQGLNDDITANCHLELTDIVFRPRTPEEEMKKAEKIATAVLDIFRALNQGKVVLNFTIKTRMDRPEFGFGDIRMAVEDKLAQARKGKGSNAQAVLMLPLKILEGAVKGATDLSKSVVDGTYALGNELKKALEVSFKREKKE